MTDTRLSVLHVLPHPGGGGERYVDSLSGMPDYRFERVYLAQSRRPWQALPKLASSVPRVNFEAGRFDIVHLHGEVPSLLCLPALARRPSVATPHGLSFVRRSAGFTARVAAANLRLVVRAATRTICVSEAERSELLKLVGESAAARVDHVPLGVLPATERSQEDRSAARAALGIFGEMAVVMVGALEYPKDPVMAACAAIDVARSGTPITLLLVGEGRLRAQVEEIANGSSGVVRVLGHRTDVRRVLMAADAFVLCSQHEGLPYALLDAMAFGLPVVVTDYPGAHVAVDEAGTVVPRGDVPRLAEVLRRLAEDPTERAALGERASSRADRLFSLDTMIDRTQSIYDDITT